MSAISFVCFAVLWSISGTFWLIFDDVYDIFIVVSSVKDEYIEDAHDSFTLKHILPIQARFAKGLRLNISRCSNIETDTHNYPGIGTSTLFVGEESGAVNSWTPVAVNLFSNSSLGTSLSVLLPLHLLAKAVLDRDLEHQAEETKISFNQSAEGSRDNTGSFSRSSCSELAAALNLSRASARVRRDNLRQNSQEASQVLVPILAKHTSKVIDDLIIIPAENNRPSVIVTPSNSPFRLHP